MAGGRAMEGMAVLYCGGLMRCDVEWLIWVIPDYLGSSEDRAREFGVHIGTLTG